VKITPSAPGISNCSQELSRRINPGHRTTRRGQQTSEFSGSAAKGEKVLDSPSRGQPIADLALSLPQLQPFPARCPSVW
jgi:hypothetical protein